MDSLLVRPLIIVFAMFLHTQELRLFLLEKIFSSFLFSENFTLATFIDQHGLLLNGVKLSD